MKKLVSASAEAHPKPAETRMDAVSHGGASQVHARPADALITVRFNDLMTLAKRLIAERLDDCDEEFMAGRAHGIGSLHSEVLGLAKRTDQGSVQDAPKSGGAPETCRSSEKVQVVQEPPPPADADSRQLVVISGQRVGKQQLLDLQRDAARYRWLRDKADGMACTAAPMVASLDVTGRVVDLIDGEDLDAAVDTAMAPAATRRVTKLKRVRNTR